MTTKTKKLSPKQFQTKTGSLLRGIDNSILTIQKHQDKIGAAASQLRETVTAFGISSETAKATKTVSKSAAKVAKKAIKDLKSAAKTTKAAKTAAKRPQLKIAVMGLLENGKTMSRKDILTHVNKKWGYSRPSLANMLKKNSDVFKVDDDSNVSLIGSSNKADDADSFVQNVQQDAAVSQVQ